MKAMCREVIAKLYLCMDGELPEPELSNLRAHIDKCEECIERYGLEKEFKELIRARCTESAPPALVEKIRAAIQQEGA